MCFLNLQERFINRLQGTHFELTDEAQTHMHTDTCTHVLWGTSETWQLTLGTADIQAQHIKIPCLHHLALDMQHLLHSLDMTGALWTLHDSRQQAPDTQVLRSTQDMTPHQEPPKHTTDTVCNTSIVPMLHTTPVPSEYTPYLAHHIQHPCHAHNCGSQTTPNIATHQHPAHRVARNTWYIPHNSGVSCTGHTPPGTASTQQLLNLPAPHGRVAPHLAQPETKVLPGHVTRTHPWQPPRLCLPCRSHPTHLAQ